MLCASWAAWQISDVPFEAFRLTFTIPKSKEKIAADSCARVSMSAYLKTTRIFPNKHSIIRASLESSPGTISLFADVALTPRAGLRCIGRASGG